MFRLTGKQSGKTIAVADIGGGDASVAIVEIFPKGPAHILAAEHSELTIEDRASDALASGTIAQLAGTAEKALSAYTAKKGKQSPHVAAAYAVIRAPWTHSKTVRAESRFAEGTRIENSMIGALAKEALGAEKTLDHSKILEASIIRVELNGYPTARPGGKHAHHVAVSTLISDCESAVQKSVSETLTKTFGCPPAKLRSGNRAILYVLRESNKLVKDCLIVNMAPEGTTMMAIRKGVVAETATLPEGTHSIIKRIAGEKMPEETLTLVRMLALDQCETESCEAVKTSIARIEPDLVKIFGEALLGMAAARRLPNTLILSAHEDLSLWLIHFFSRIDFAQFTITTRPFSPSALARADLEDLVVLENAGTDANLCVASALVNIEEHAA